MPNLLVVDDDVMMLRYLRTVLECEHYQVAIAASGAEALQELRRRPLPDLVLMDLVMPDMDGLETLARLREIAPSVKVIMLSGSKEAREVVQAMKLGAHDYLCKPVGQAELVATLKNCLDVSPAIAENPEVLEELSSDSFFLAASPAMHKVHEQIRRIAEVDVPVFITGESGTGKEIASLLLHKLSSRSQKKFLKVNCAAIPEESAGKRIVRLRGWSLYRGHPQQTRTFRARRPRHDSAGRDCRDAAKTPGKTAPSVAGTEVFPPGKQVSALRLTFAYWRPPTSISKTRSSRASCGLIFITG